MILNFKFPDVDAIGARSSIMEHSEYQPRLRERKHLRASKKDYKRVKRLKIKAYNEKVPHRESLDRVNASRLDLRLANKLN
ncbi:MAG: hypothetical protein WCD53_12555, partial [Microcoleus sp.]